MEVYPLLSTLGKPCSNATGIHSETWKPDNRPHSERPHAAQSVTIHDVAGDEDQYALDSHGFQFVKHASREEEFLDDQTIKAGYYPEVEQLLKDV